MSNVDFSSDFGFEFSSFAAGHVVNPLLLDTVKALSGSSILSDSGRVTSGFVYQNFHRALKDMNMLLGIFYDSCAIPVTLIERRVSEGAIVVCFASLAADINKTISYIQANNL